LGKDQYQVLASAWRQLDFVPFHVSYPHATWRSLSPADTVLFVRRAALTAVSKYSTAGPDPAIAPASCRRSSTRLSMITAIVLIKAEPRLIPQCGTKLAGIEGVAQVYSVSGEWDLVAIVEVADYQAVATVVTEHITAVPGLRSTQTLTAFRAYSKKDLEQAWDIGLE
jgi:DNA-binding Lrp family transcriptional regulator